MLTSEQGERAMGKRMGVFVVAAVFVFVLAGAGLASPPVPPPEEGYIITTNCDVNMGTGDFIEDEEFTWTYVTDYLIEELQTLPGPSVDPMFLGIAGRAAQIRYDEQLRSVDSGSFQLDKGFSATSHEEDDPNLNVEKDYAWTGQAGSGITNVENRERAGLSVVASGEDPVVVPAVVDFFPPIPPDGDAHNEGQAPAVGGGALPGPFVRDGLDDMPGLCPWVRDNPIPATNEFIAMGSRTTASGATGQIASHTRTDVTSTGPPSINHNISAVGSAASAEAEMRVQLMEGDGSVDADIHGTIYWQEPGFPLVWDDYVALYPPNLISLTEYEEYTGAFGIFEFNKQMHYHSEIPDWQMPEPWYEILDNAPALP